jgi:PKD repeat protein
VVTVSAPLRVDVITPALGASGDAPLLVNFTASPVGIDGPFTEIWNFGDGSPTVSGLSASHAYLAPGLYNAVVTATDALGRTANASVVISVVSSLVVAASASHPAGVAPFPASLAAAADGGTAPFSFDWSFGDGSPNASGADVGHTYTTPGRYVAEVLTTDAGGGRVVGSVVITVVAPLVATASANASYAIAPASVGFVSMVSGGLAPDSFSWAFGDGAVDLTANATHLFTTVGSYTVNFTVTDRLGETVRQSVSFDTYAPFRASESASPASFVLGSTTTITASASGGAGLPTFTWSGLPPGCTSSTAPSLTCTPTAVGTYNVTVSALDARGDPATASVVVNVTSAAANPSPLGTGPAGGLVVVALAAVAGFVVGAVVVYLAYRGRRTPESAAGSPAGDLEGSPPVERVE